MVNKFQKHYSFIQRSKSKFYSSVTSQQKILRGGKVNLSSFLFWLKFIGNLLLKYKARSAVFLIILVVIILIIKTLIPNLPVFRNNLVIGVIGEYTSANLPQTLTQLYSQGLTKFDETGFVVPDLVESWKTEDGKKFQFFLKDNFSWQDGKRLTASEIQIEPPNVGAQVHDEKTIEFILKDTYSAFPQLLTKPVFRKNSQVGTGPYRLAKIVKTGETLRQIVLVPVKNNLPQVTIQFFPNSQIATQAFKTGRVSLLFNLMRLNGLENWKGTEIIQTLDTLRLVAVFYNTKDELLANVKVRKALDLSIDRSKMKNLAAGPYPPNSWVKLEVEPDFDLKKAAKLLKDEKIDNKKITILTPLFFENLTKEIAVNWQSLGFEVKVEKIDKIPENFQVAIFGLEIPADPDQYSFWHSTQSNTLTKIEDPKLDKLLEDGRKSIKIEERKETYQQLQRELRDLVPASFLFFQDRYIVINKNSQKKVAQIKNLFPKFPIN